MNKIKVNYWIDVCLAITFLLVFITGIFKWPGLITKFGISYSDLPMRTFTFIHDWSGLIMGLLVLIHLILHWNWIVSVTKSMIRGKK